MRLKAINQIPIFSLRATKNLIYQAITIGLYWIICHFQKQKSIHWSESFQKKNTSEVSLNLNWIQQFKFQSFLREVPSTKKEIIGQLGLIFN